MKVKFNLLLFSMLLLIFPSFVYAASIDVECPEKVNQNTSFTCTIKGNFSQNVDHILIKYSYNSKLSYSNLELLDNWTLSSDESNNNKSFVIENNNNKIGSIVFAKIKFNVSDNIQGQNLDLQFYGFDATNSSAELIDFSPSVINKSIYVNSTNNSLKQVSIDGDVIEINDSVSTYNYITNKSSVNIVGELVSQTSICEDLSRTVELNEGVNDVLYTVIAEDGTSRIYTLKITYDINASNENQNISNDDNDSTDNSSASSEQVNNNDTNSNFNPFNPFTGDNIIFYVAILITCLIIFGFVLLGLKKKKE